jgi:hypothetical protein
MRVGYPRSMYVNIYVFFSAGVLDFTHAAVAEAGVREFTLPQKHFRSLKDQRRSILA